MIGLYYRFWAWLEEWLDPTPTGPVADLGEILARPLTVRQREIVHDMAWQAETYGEPLLADDVEWALVWIKDYPLRLDGTKPGTPRRRARARSRN